MCGVCVCVRTTFQRPDEVIEQNDELFDINSEQLTALLVTIPQAAMQTNTAAEYFSPGRFYSPSCSLNRELGPGLF